MSSILKALKKLEKETSISKPEQLGIDSKILQDGSAKFTRTTLIIIAAALFICGGGATYLYMKRTASNRTEEQTSSQRAETHTRTTVIQPVVHSDMLQPTVIPFSQPQHPPIVERQPYIPDNTPQLLQQSPTLNKTMTPPIQVSPPLPVSEPEPRVSTSKSALTTRPVLTVNGIAFQEGGNENLAVINGITVSNGSVIEGIKVEGIQKDRVHFSQGGEKFEIILNKSNR